MTAYPSSIKTILPGAVIPSGNEIHNWKFQRTTWKIKQLKKDYWNLLVIDGAHQDKFKIKGKVRRKVIFTSFRSRRIDDDNLSNGFKYLRDTLTEMRLIHDDSPKYLEAEYHQEIDSKNHRVEVEIFGEFEANVLKSSRRMI